MRSIFFSISKFSIVTITLLVALVISAVNKDVVPKAVAMSLLIPLLLSLIWLVFLVLRLLFGKKDQNEPEKTGGTTKKRGYLWKISVLVVLVLAVFIGIGVYSGKSNLRGKAPHAKKEFSKLDASIRVPSLRVLLGEWNQVAIVPITYQFDPTSFWFTGPQHYEFLPENKLRTIIIESTGTNTPTNTASAFVLGRTIPPKNSYVLNNNGIVVITQEDGKKLAARLGYLSADLDAQNLDDNLAVLFKQYAPRKGNLLMTFINNKGEPLFMRIFEKVNDRR